MKHKINIKSLALGALLSAVGTFSIAATTGTRAWEYKIISGKVSFSTPGDPLLGKQLDQAAADNWEVVSAASDEGRPLVILRRAR
jgi:hypothetical protein